MKGSRPGGGLTSRSLLQLPTISHRRTDDTVHKLLFACTFNDESATRRKPYTVFQYHNLPWLACKYSLAFGPTGERVTSALVRIPSRSPDR